MKKIIIILTLFCIVLLAVAGIVFSLRNIGEYNKEEKTMAIRNSILSNVILAEVQLKSPQVVYVFRGQDRKVAEFEINNIEKSYSNVFTNMEFYDIKNNMSKFDKKFTYKYKKSLGFETINDYKQICEDKISLNGTKYKECHQELIGTHQEEIFEWIELDISKELPIGKITIGIFTDVYPNEHVEWIPTLFGVRIDKWASYIETFLSDGLIGYFPFNESAGATLHDYSGNGYDGTLNNMEDADWVIGLVDNALSFDGSDESVTMVVPYSSAETKTTSLLFKTDTSQAKHILGARNSTVGDSDRGISFTATSISIPRYDSDDGSISHTFNYNDSNWHHLVVVENSTGAGLYLDGVLVIASDNQQDFTNLAATYFAIGARTNNGVIESWANVILDDLAIWNKSLSSIEVSDLYAYYTITYPAITLNSPVNAYNSTSSTIIFNGTVYDTGGKDIVNVTLYIDGILNETNSSGINNTYYIFTKTITDGNYNWTYEACDNGSQCTTATTRTFNINTTPHIQFENPTPVNEYNSSIANYFIANVSLTETYFQNLTFYLYNETAIANTTIYTDSTRIINWTGLSDGKYSYNATVWTNTSQYNSTETRNITIDINPPVINITYPTATINYHILNTNLSLNWTVSDINLDTCWYNYNGTNITVICSDNTTQINISDYSNRNVTFYANDTFGKLNSSYQEWDYKVFENQQTFSLTTIEGSTETFINNIFLGNGETIIEINFNYNGTDKSAEHTDLGGNEYNLSSTFIIPSVISEANITFFWKIFLVSGQVNSGLRNQTVKSINIDNCSVFSNVIFNYTIIDEKNQNKLTNNTILELDIEIFDKAKTVSILNFSTKYNNTNPAVVCLDIELTNETIYALDSTVKYEATNYSIEYYNIQNFSLQNLTIPQNINLFDLLLSDSTEFQITFKDSNFIVIENALIQINRQYLSEGLFKTVEIPKTDSNGQTVAHLVEKDVVYNIIVLKEGKVLGTFNNIIAFCEDILIGSCFISLNALAAGEVSFDYDDEIELFFDFDYNETSRNLQFDFSTTDGSVKNITLFALKMDQLGNETVCDKFLISSSGSIVCAVPASIGNETIIVSIFVDGDLKITNYVQAGREFDIGDAGYFLMFFLVLSLALMMTQSKTGVIIGVILGFISGVLLSFIQGGLMGIGSSVIWLIIMGVILIYKLNSQGQT